MTWLRPNTLGLVLFLPCLALAQYLPASGLTVWLAIAMGRFAISPTATWATLLGVQLVGVYVVSMPLGELLAMATRPRRRDVLLAVCATAVAAFVAAVIVSEQYWGYYFRRPALDERVARARQVHAVTFVETQGAGEPSRFVASPDQSLEAAIRAGRKHPYDFPSYRALVTLADRRLLPEGPAPVRAATLASAHAWLEATGLLVPGEAGYPHAKRLSGVLLELEDERARRSPSSGSRAERSRTTTTRTTSSFFRRRPGPGVRDGCPRPASSTTSRASRARSGG